MVLLLGLGLNRGFRAVLGLRIDELGLGLRIDMGRGVDG